MRDSLYPSDPWNVPVPLEKAAFEPLDERDRKYAVRTDLGAIEAFAVPSEGADVPCLFADLQLCPEMQIGLRLGSGRAGFFGGKYLKGVGRTTLAGNWNSARDTYHATGHMFASAAVREWVVTRYLAAKGGLDFIVPCEGVLFAALKPSMREGMLRFESATGTSLAPIDRALQGITVKPASFARLSNVAWSLSRMAPYARRFADLGYRTEAYARAVEQGLPAATECTPSSIAAALSQAVERACHSILLYPRYGVYWGSYHNNFTLDGRFLDIELPTFCGGPFVGCHIGRSTREPQVLPRDTDAVLIGTELFDYLHHVKAMVEFMIGRLRYLSGYCADPLAHAFAKSLADALESTFGPEHIVYDAEAQVERVCAAMVAAGGDPVAVAQVCRSHWHTAQAGDAGEELVALGLELKPGTHARAEPTRYSGLYHAAGISELLVDRTMDDEAEFMNRALVRADEHTDVDALLAYLRELGGQIERHVSPAQDPAQARRTGV